MYLSILVYFIFQYNSLVYFRKSHRNTDLTNYIMIQYIPCKVTSGHICPEKATIGLSDKTIYIWRGNLFIILLISFIYWFKLYLSISSMVSSMDVLSSCPIDLYLSFSEFLLIYCKYNARNKSKDSHIRKDYIQPGHDCQY